ncbi:hypothetical protein JK358_06330 [Nocardia sp. 2]|uniref:Uncharacterized protein n=1 Tax=Nocardia acididurans TaxID=2802282 RepID=A0ABS1M017_9NOCA|nr:hypothetical protein [Nocardia acididurans]MBL1074007.1 hypothetical protein [Nocardia acididurans]
MGELPREAEEKTDPIYGPSGFAAAFGMSVSCLLCLCATMYVGIPWAVAVFGRPHVRPEEESAVVIACALLLAVMLAGAAWLRPRSRRAGMRGAALALAAGSLLSMGLWWLFNHALNTERWNDRRAGLVQFGVVVPDAYEFAWGRSGCGTGLVEQSCWQKFYYTAPLREFDSYERLFPQGQPGGYVLPFRAGTCDEAFAWELDCAAGDIVVRGSSWGGSVLVMRTATEMTLAVEVLDDAYPVFFGRCEGFRRCL